MKLQELVNIGNPVKSKKIKMIITETQFKVLAKNVLNEQEKKTIKNTHLIKKNTNAKKK
jgi:hypothetical protein